MMSFKLQWYAENNVIYICWPENVDVEVAEQYMQETLRYLENSTRSKVHTISDATHVKQILPLLEARKFASALNAPKMGWTITYGTSNPLLKMVVQMVTNVVPVRVRFVKDLDEAIHFLTQVDPDLPDLNQFRGNIPDC